MGLTGSHYTRTGNVTFGWMGTPFSISLCWPGYLLDLEMTFTLTKATVREFARQNRPALGFLNRGTDNYIAARCCLLNGLLSGLELGALAVEKHMKAMLLFNDSGTKVRPYNHRLDDLTKEIEKRNLASLSSHTATLNKLTAHKRGGYPDEPGASTEASTEEFRDIDKIMDVLLEKMPAPEEVLLTAGVNAWLLSPSQVGQINRTWLLKENPALQMRQLRVTERWREWNAWMVGFGGQ